MEWTRSYISSFGGDPAKTTLFGQSSGGCLSSAHFFSPASFQQSQPAQQGEGPPAPLFNNLISSSGGFGHWCSIDLETAGDQFRDLYRLARDHTAARQFPPHPEDIPPCATHSCMREFLETQLSELEIMKLEAKTPCWAGCQYQLTVDKIQLQKSMLDLLEGGVAGVDFSDRPVLHGTTSDDGFGFMGDEFVREMRSPEVGRELLWGWPPSGEEVVVPPEGGDRPSSGAAAAEAVVAMEVDGGRTETSRRMGEHGGLVTKRSKTSLDKTSCEKSDDASSPRREKSGGSSPGRRSPSKRGSGSGGSSASDDESSSSSAISHAKKLIPQDLIVDRAGFRAYVDWGFSNKNRVGYEAADEFYQKLRDDLENAYDPEGETSHMEHVWKLRQQEIWRSGWSGG